jgi:hypothetical protein
MVVDIINCTLFLEEMLSPDHDKEEERRRGLAIQRRLGREK